ncbi:exosome nuclease subunit [Coemansia sp. RSA 552]|nr:exosome nuclease subunit [Coemansia sp. RSA 552]
MADFIGKFDQSLAAAFGALVQATKAAGKLPEDIGFHRTLDEGLDTRLEGISQRVLRAAQKLYETPGESLEIDGVEDVAVNEEGAWKAGPGFRPAVEAVDTLLERVDVGLDEVLKTSAHRMRESATRQSQATVTRVAGSGSGKRSDVRLVHAQNIARPQLEFKDSVDNSATPFVWKIREKYHARVPLDHGLPSPAVAQSPLGPHLQAMGISRPASPSGADNEAAMTVLPHPYEFEIKNIEYPKRLFEEASPQEPKDWEQTPFEFIDTPEQLAKMMEHLQDAKEVAIDLEHHDYRSYQGFTCLVQVSSRSRDFVVDALALRSELPELNRVTADPRIIKVFHGADMDVQWLQRDFGVYLVGLFDTYHASKVLNMPHHSLAHLLRVYCGYAADKKYQLADWRIRPIPDEMMRYARADTHFLLYVFDQMRNDLLARGTRLVGIDVSNPDHAEHFGQLAGIAVVESAVQPVEVTMQRSAQTALKLYVKEGYDADHGMNPGGWARLLRKWGHPFAPAQLAVFRALHQWRDNCAREEDESPRYVLPNHQLFAIADRMPREPAQLLALCQPTPPLVRLYATDLVRLISQHTDATQRRLEDTRQMIEDASREVEPMPKPVHTRFADTEDVPMDVVEQVEDDVLSSELLGAVQAMVSPQSSLFCSSLAPSSSSTSMAAEKAREIRSNLVLTIAMPKSVEVPKKEEAFTTVKRKQPEPPVEEEEEPRKPETVVISSTYITPKKQKKDKAKKSVDDLDLSKIALADGPEKPGRKRAKKKSKPSKQSEVTPHQYAEPSDDLIGEVMRQSAKKPKGQKGKKAFDPYARTTGSSELDKRPRRSRVTSKSGNKSMSYKK